MTKIWQAEGDEYFFLRTDSKKYDKLPIGVYEVVMTLNGPMVHKIYDQFTFDFKLYGLETNLIARIKKTYAANKNNLGVILNGMRGTGKTVTAKQLCNDLKVPVILISDKDDDNSKVVENYINSIPQDIIIFVDEYEKIYEEDDDLLTIMDGALTSTYKRTFILTTNKLYINENLLDRTGRIRYIQNFGNLPSVVVKEVLDDLLINKEFYDETFSYISMLQNITIDIIKSVIEEINIHNEPPSTFENVFNASKVNGKYDVYEIVKDQLELVKLNTKISPNQDTFDDSDIESTFYVDNKRIGSIIEVNGENVITVKCEVRPTKKDAPVKYENKTFAIKESVMFNYAFQAKTRHVF